MSKQLLALLAGVLVAVVLVAGCGGDDNEATASSIGKAEFIKKAEAICEQGNKKIQTAFAAYSKENDFSLSNEPTEAEYADLIDAVLLPSANQEIEDIRALGAPSGDEDQVEAILDAREESIEKAEADPEAAAAGTRNIFSKSSQLAKEYGFKECALR